MRVHWSIQERPYSTALFRAFGDRGEVGSNVVALLFGGELGFFPPDQPDSYQVEIARFFARRLDCRDPVAVPYSAIEQMARWNPSWGNWRFMTDHWLTDRRWAGTIKPQQNHVTDRQAAALHRLREILEELEAHHQRNPDS